MAGLALRKSDGAHILVAEPELSTFLPKSLQFESLDQSTIPQLAKNKDALAQIQSFVSDIPTHHYLIHGDARSMECLTAGSIHLAITSPPYWTLKQYDPVEGQLGHITSYDEFLAELSGVWKQCYDLLVPGGRLICVVGDVCLSRRQNEGRHTVVPLHSSIQEMCRKMGFDNLAPIFWYKISNAQYEVNEGSGFLGKPYEPNAVIKNDVEYILMFRKSGGYRKPSIPKRIFSVIGTDEYQQWFQQIWSGIGGASTKEHPAPYPVEIADRLIRMFSFVGDTVLDPFSGSGTTSIAAARSGRSSIGFEISSRYHLESLKRFRREIGGLFGGPTLHEGVEA